VCSIVVCVAAVLCVWVSVRMLLFDFRERQCAVVSVLCRCVAVSLCCCVAVSLCVALRCVGRSLRLSVAVVAQQQWRCAGV
jgi:hypothetical protein